MKTDKENKGITTRAENYSEWYLDIIEAAELAENGPAKGTMIIKPYGFAIWELIQAELDHLIKQTGVQNAYFPLLIPEKLLQREKEHVEGFSPELAVVTIAGGKKLKENYVIRPTSETIMYETFAKWVRSHKDLPLLINQWNNVVRWELRPRLFLRTTEFLWQEGHTAHATEKEADERAQLMLQIYTDFAKNFLAIPCLAGAKSNAEKFAGAQTTYSVEAMMQDGKALQFATSHNLGQNFSKPFNIRFQTEDSSEKFAWQTSWGLSTRVIGGLIMTHSDDKGLVLPPNVAPIQAVIIPIWKDAITKKEILKKAGSILSELEKNNLRVKLDDRDSRPGEKYYEWEKKGVPVRIEIGPKDLEKNSAVLARRDEDSKTNVNLKNLADEVKKLLSEIQANLLKQAEERLKKNTKTVTTWKEFEQAIEENKFILAPWSGDAKVEAEIKKKTTATIRCLPADQPSKLGKCIYSDKPGKFLALFAKAY